jgi:S-adenosylmethionine:tRNA ribosyltransferase-isomerase
MIEKCLSLYDFRFPASRIAQCPATPRDSSRLMVFDRRSGKVIEDRFRNIAEHLPQNAVLVLNETKVVPAKLILRRQTGGKVEMLMLRREKGAIVVWANRRLEIGERLMMTARAGFVVVSVGREMTLKPDFPMCDLDRILERCGSAPLPPYIKHCPLPPRELRRRYQTVFARTPGSIAAPTASLHFTTRLLRSLTKRGITIERVTLHVHLGTFAPLTEDHLRSGKLHREAYVIDSATAKRLQKHREAGRPIVAVGTTVVRTLESVCDARGRIKRLRGTTDLFIREGYRFRFVDAMVTNFHVPRSSLLMLVAAFCGQEPILRLYRRAIRRGFRFFSFGDAMLIR